MTVFRTLYVQEFISLTKYDISKNFIEYRNPNWLKQKIHDGI